MKRFKRPSLLLITALAALVLLPLLAYWQYRWLGAVSEAERKRMRENLQTAASQFAEAFDRELAAAFHHLRPALSQPQSESVFPLQYRQWLGTTKHPGLVKDVYEVQFDKAAAPRLWRFDAQAAIFVPQAWDDSLAELQACVEREREAAQMRLSRPMPPLPKSATVIQLSLNDPFNDMLPGLVWPLDEPENHSSPAARYRVAVFDFSYILQTMLPVLAQRYLLTAQSDAYELAVFKRGDRTTTLYRHGVQTKTDWTTADVAQGFGKVSEQDHLPLLLQMPIEKLAGAFSNKMPSVHIERQSSEVFTLHSDKNKASGLRRVTVAPKQSQTVVTMGASASGNLPSIDLLQNVLQSKTDGAWQLVVKHRAGSLEAAVNQVRRRNLAISFGIVLLLGLSVVLMIVASRRAQALAAQQMEFVAGVSHELRTPLAVICSAAENLADGVVANPAQTQQYGTLIRDEGRRLSGMVEQVLEFAGAQSGKRAYELKPVNPSEVIDDALNALRMPLTEQGFYVEEDLPPRLPLIKADAAALSRALQNLLTNAMKYSDVSRWITLRATVVNHSELQVIVEDRGIGIPADELPRLGEAFYRGKAVVAAQIHGNGLGLSLVKQIAQAHGGRLSVTSEAGQGSAFTLHIPLPTATKTQLAMQEFSEHWQDVVERESNRFNNLKK